jgi:hypothetical protein
VGFFWMDESSGVFLDSEPSIFAINYLQIMLKVLNLLTG